MDFRLKLSSIRFRSGSNADSPPLEISCPNVLIFIGPNNSGKSQALRDILFAIIGTENPPRPVVIEQTEIEIPNTEDEILEAMEIFRETDQTNRRSSADVNFYVRPGRQGYSETKSHIRVGDINQYLKKQDYRSINRVFTCFFTRLLDGSTRFELIKDQPSGPLENSPQNHLWMLFQNLEARERISAFTQNAFNKYFVIDPTGMTIFRMRLSDRPPTDINEEQGLDARAQLFHQSASLLSNFGDGVKASVGLVAAVHSFPDRFLLIDEPEAFLHPTLARRIGSTLAQTAYKRNASLVVATHSAEFLVGAIQATTQLRIVRLTYEAGTSTARTLDPVEITKLMSDPLLRSANVMRALFHRGVVVCEADADRAFYEEINARLAADSRGIDDALFMNAQGWQTIHRIVLPLRQLGVPAAAVYDIDVLMDKDFGHIWLLINSSQIELLRLQKSRNTIKIKMDKISRDSIKRNGINALSEDKRIILKDLIEDFTKYGVFFVPTGELENWLSFSGVPRAKKTKWINEIFEYMGTDPESENYLKPGQDDIWRFISDIGKWINNPARLGIPD